MKAYQRGRLDGLGEAMRIAIDLRRKARGPSEHEKGQRRSATRMINALGPLLDPAPSFSEDDIDEGLKA